jgi:signal transduction histidine kinase
MTRRTFCPCVMVVSCVGVHSCVHTPPGHEIRNPLHGINAGVDSCLSGELSPKDVHAELLAISDGVVMMTSLLNDLMDLQKMRMGKFSVEEKQVAPLKLVEVRARCCYQRWRRDVIK